MSNAPVQKPWYRQFWPWFLVLLPLAVVIACFYTVFLALDNPLSMVKDDYYKEGLAINQNNVPYQRARDLGLSAQLRLRSSRQVEIRLFTTTPWSMPRDVALELGHPVDSERDQKFLLPQQSGVFLSSALDESEWESLLLEKRWYFTLRSGDAALRGEITLDPTRVILLDAGRE